MAETIPPTVNGREDEPLLAPLPFTLAAFLPALTAGMDDEDAAAFEAGFRASMEESAARREGA